jgi:hypothetical protein
MYAKKDAVMHYPDKEKLLNEQTTVPAEPPAVENRQVWPPLPRPRPRQGPPLRTKILITSLAALLIFGGLSLFIYATTGQYDRALRTQDGADATVTAQSRISSQATRASRARATAGPLQTADAQIYATATVQAGPAATASAAGPQSTATAQTVTAEMTRITGSTATLIDPLSDNSKGNVWDQGYTDNNNTGCNFVNSSYQALEALAGYLRPCFADNTSFSNFAYQATMILKTNCSGGLLLRGKKSASQYYLFLVDANGNYQFEVYAGSNQYRKLASGTNSAILAGAGQTNTLAVIANQGVFDLFVNQTFVTEVVDGQLSAGQIGVVASNTGLPASASFSNAEVWKI